ncbi:Transcriptional regulator, SARP family [Frankia sp. Hr75.2]|nr:Transcriptional regulator, SARP family [Frankia sp. Hr75.2]
MRYELLGPLRVSNSRESHLLSAPKMETTLAVLLVGADPTRTIVTKPAGYLLRLDGAILTSDRPLDLPTAS